MYPKYVTADDWGLFLYDVRIWGVNGCGRSIQRTFYLNEKLRTKGGGGGLKTESFADVKQKHSQL